MIQIEDDIKELAELLPQIMSIADGEKEALGFLPLAAFRDACAQRRLIAAVEEIGGVKNVIGYILFGGIFPRARVYQIAIAPHQRRFGFARKLIGVLVARLEAAGYLSLSARVATDLERAVAFYTSNEFRITREVSGGASRARKLLILDRRLKTEDLLSRLDVGHSHGDLLALALRSAATGDSPFYVIDLNVLFDLIRDRERSGEARQLFAAALAHRVRLVVSPEFLAELKRTTSPGTQDPVLHMALQLPQLVHQNPPDLKRVAAIVHRIVFEDTGSRAAGRPQSISDSRHVAHSALSGASAFITSDAQILAARDRLRNEVGIDVASLAELLELVPDDSASTRQSPMRGGGFELTAVDAKDLREYLQESRAPEGLVAGYARDIPGQVVPRRYAVRQGGKIVAASALKFPSTPTSSARLLLYSNPKVFAGDLYYDALFDRAAMDAASRGPALIELQLIPTDPSGAIHAFARSRGFMVGPNASTMFKVVLGRPLTLTSWRKVALALERRTGLVLKEAVEGEQFARLTAHGQVVQLPHRQLEDFLGPTAIAWPGRQAVIQPITQHYSEELLGTARQASFLEKREAAFLSREKLRKLSPLSWTDAPWLDDSILRIQTDRRQWVRRCGC